MMVRKFQIIFISVLLLWAMIIGCEKSPVVPQETFSVVATISAVTMDKEGIAISVPVTFMIYRDASSDLTPDKLEESLILKSDEEGYVEYRHEFFFQGDEQSSIIADVSSPDFESIQYWTAYFSINDTPAKRVEIVLEVVPK